MKEQDFGVTPKTTAFRYGEETTRRVVEALPHAATGEQVSPVALLVCHGMGEQVRFETIGQIAASLLKEAAAKGCRFVDTGVHLSLQGDGFLARAELSWTTPEGDPHAVHVYEAYWAPITEGQVTYYETVTFLFAAAWKGIVSSKFFKPCDFERFMFGAIRKLPIYSRTKVALLCVALFLTAQVLAIAVVLAKIADQIKQLETAHFAIKQVIEILSPGIHVLRSSTEPWHHKFWAAMALLGWYALVAEIVAARYFLVEYAGDVAAYISPYKASKFEEIRSKIQAVGLDVAKVIYGFEASAVVPEYRRVVVAGHSLGSVLAYDTLNAVLNLDLTSDDPGSKRVLERTKKLITFGSPLDKTAFLFRNQSNHVKDPLREQMATGFQPLILDAKFRRPDLWTNLWSPLDIVSGSLDYYDLPQANDSVAKHPEKHRVEAGKDADVYDPHRDKGSARVENLKDPACTVPIAAHVQYWAGSLLGGILYEAVKS